MTNPIGAVLVVGAGIGGIQTSLDLAEAGFKVYLLDKSPAIGGTMAQLDKTFPTNDCAMCILSPKLVECGRHLNIEIMTYAELESVEGEPGNLLRACARNHATWSWTSAPVAAIARKYALSSAPTSSTSECRSGGRPRR